MGDVVIWDERSTNHRAVADHFPQVREVRRCEIEGERPYFDPDAEAPPVDVQVPLQDAADLQVGVLLGNRQPQPLLGDEVVGAQARAADTADGRVDAVDHRPGQRPLQHDVRDHEAAAGPQHPLELSPAAMQQLVDEAISQVSIPVEATQVVDEPLEVGDLAQVEGSAVNGEVQHY